MKPRKMDFEWDRRARQAIAHGALTNSKRPESFVKGVYPTHLRRAYGCRVVDTNESEYVDFVAGLGTNLLGYGQEEIAQAIASQGRLGCTLSLGTELEVRLAEKLKEVFPFVDRWRFFKSGSEACSAAVRIARTATKRDLVLSDGYHGWHDDFVSLTPPANGVPMQEEDGYTFISRPSRQWIRKIGTFGRDAAAIIVEPVITDASSERIETLKQLRRDCTSVGALLIFDEIITGFRFAQYSVAQHYNVQPDLICLGKAFGGGMPLAAVGGKKEVMETDYFVSSTFAGATVSLAASLKFLDLLQSGKFKLDYLWQKGHAFQADFNKIWSRLQMHGYGTRGVFVGEDLTKALFMQECIKAGYLVGPSWFLTFPHVEILEQCLSVFADILNRIKLGEVRLEGEIPIKPYAQRAREK